MKNNKGQALVEFIIVMPVLIFIIMAIIDFGNIAYKKIKLENHLSEIENLYNEQKFDKINSLASNENFYVTYKTENDLTTIKLEQNIKIFTPFLNLALGDNYKLETKRVIYEK